MLTKFTRPRPLAATSEHVVARRVIDEWAERRFGKAAAEITNADIRAMPKLGGLRYRSSKELASPLGGRIAPHLRYLEEDDAITLLRRADDFLATGSSRWPSLPS